ncbi:long-chain acyl-CoA synthetase [Microbacteriaceae bacterium SG_E_30_P1]|uniref:Long-chain acyl-CoA synthetase n=1 Tax=Antiquaquibacter oligotrophicus TaxID=2880260 RepID=A0ABT6KSU0_9MICO|nr:class I adenylate-forming enzyme family protein [Antiquaquibacter oligotrophicus]MDH6182573.1 long-chain acyl-CoA synthetase [Antiquaquibacter oligotrophicus]UDF14460.1 acyl--CoA ligase [Antiquaquibacter oligotrophicus]
MSAPNPFLYLQRHADENPHGVFIHTPTQTITNADAVVNVKKIAYELRRLGVAPGDIVALDLPDQLSIMFTEAVYHEGGISTVIPDGATVDPRVGVRWLFTNRGTAAPNDATAVLVDAPFLQRIEQNPYGIRASEHTIDTLRIVFSSGTTGTPKAIALGRRMEMLMDAALPQWFQGSPYLSLMDTGTVAGIGEFFLSMKAGQPFLSAGGANPETLIRMIDKHQVRTLKGSPAQVVAIIDELERQGRTLPSVQSAMVAGTVMPPQAAERARRVFEGCLVLTSYGSTEAGGATIRPYESDDPFDVGHVQPGSTIEIVDEAGELVAPGEVGVIRHRSPGMAEGYLGNPEATAEVFRDGWFYPGDRGFFREDGGLTLAGRDSEVLNAGGVKFDPNLLDHAALDHPGVTDAASFTYTSGSGLAQVGLALVASDDVDPKAVVADLRATFGAAAPALVARVDSIPRSRTGKPLRRELAERFGQ